MRFTGDAARLPLQEQAKIFYWAAKIGVQPEFLAAIRMAENGGPGREFGVLSQEANTYDLQCKLAALSIRNNLFRFVTDNSNMWPTVNDRYSNVFIAYMGRRWAPVGARNDPNGLNKNWIVNVTNFYKETGVEEV